MGRLPEDKVISKLLLQRFQAEGEFDGGDGRHYACILRDNGDLLVHHPGSPNLSPDQVIWAGDVLRGLNRELHHDGAWAVVFTHPKPAHVSGCVIYASPMHRDYARYALIYIDQDGDPQFTVEWTEHECEEIFDFADVMLAGIHSTMQKCEAAWGMWKHTRDVLDLKPEQTFKRAQGQAPSSARH